MKNFKIVFAHEFRETVRSAPYITLSIIFALMILAAAVVPGLLAGALPNMSGMDMTNMDAGINMALGGGESPKVALLDKTGGELGEQLKAALPWITFDAVSENIGDYTDLVGKEGGYSAVVVLTGPASFDCYEPFDIYATGGTVSAITAALTAINRANILAENGVDAAVADQINQIQITANHQMLGDMDVGNYIYNFIMVILMFLFILLYGQMVAARVAAEKSSRTMELLLTSASPDALLHGKVLATGAAAIIQLTAFLAALFGVIGVTMAGSQNAAMFASLINIRVLDILYMCGYGLLGFLMMAYFFGSMGSLVSQMEDLNGIITVPMLLIMPGYLISVISTSTGQSGAFIKVASFIPFWSPMVMFSRRSTENVPDWQVTVSLLLIAVTAWFIAKMAVRIYRRGMLMYGKPPKLAQLAAMLRAK